MTADAELLVRLALLLFWLGLVSVDERASASLGFHQPIVSGTVAGWLMGNLDGGAGAGLVFQALWPGLLPVGGTLLPAVGIAGGIAGAVAGWGAHLVGTRALLTPDGPLLFGVVVGLVAAWIGGAWERGTRRRNLDREERALAVSGPLLDALERARRSALFDTALRGVILGGAAVFLAGVVYLWPAALRLLGASPVPEVGRALRPAAFGLGLGGLLLLFDGPRPHLSRPVAAGLAAGVLFQLLRGL
jgi:hypothetical protein